MPVEPPEWASPHWQSLATAVGWVAIHSARTEIALERLLVALVGTWRAAPIVLGQGWSSSRTGCDALLRERRGHDPYLHMPPEEVATIDEHLRLLRSVDALMQDRSLLLHAQWRTDGWEPLEALLHKRWGRHRFAEWTIDAIEKLRTDLSEAEERLLAAAVHYEEYDRAATER